MKTCKKLFSLLLVAVMLVAAIPTFAFAAPMNYELILRVDDAEVLPTRPTANIDKDAGASLDSNGEYSTAPGTDGFNVLALFPEAAAYTSTGYDCTEVKFNDSKAMVRVELKTKTCTHDWEVLTVGVTDTQHAVRCKICNAQKMVDHDWQELTPRTEPTHTSVGHAAVEQCKDCGKQRGGEELPKLKEHNFSADGQCECGALKYTITVDLDGTEKTVYYVDDAGNADMTSAPKVLEKVEGQLGIKAGEYTTSGWDKTDRVIRFAAKKIPTTTSYTNLALTVDGKSENVGITPAYTKSGSVSNSDAADILKAAKRSYDLTKYNVEVKASGSTIYMTLNTIGRYTVNCIVNGEKFAPKTNVPYYGTFTNGDALAILKAADITVTGNYQQSIVSVSGSVITVELYNEIVVRVYNNANSFSQVTMRVGYPYINYLGTNLINNATFGGITIKNQAGQNTYRSASDVNGGKALVGAYDEEVTIQRNGDSCTLNFLRSDGTVLESRKLYAGDQIGTLPSYIVGNVPAVWTYNGKPISATDVYNFKTTSVNIQPYFGGISDVYVDVYTNGNVKTLQTRVKVTDMVQNGVLYLNSEVKSAISSALRNSSNKNLTYTAFFDASTWSDFIKTKNTNGAAEPIRVGDNSERQGSVYLYVMVNNVTQKATDSTNPKTGDDVKLGVAAAVLAVAVVGFGAAIVIKKKKGVQ